MSSDTGTTMTSPRLMAALFIIALGVRLILPFAGFTGIVGDSWCYLSEGQGFIEGKGFLDPQGNLTAIRPPVYPLFVGGMLALSGMKTVGIQIIQAVLTALLAPLIFSTVRPLVGATRAFIAGAVFALDPVSIPFSASVLTEAIGSILLFLWFLSWLRTLRRPTTGEFLWSGLLSGAMLYQTMITILIQPIALGARFLAVRADWKRIILSGIIMVIPLSLWTTRNNLVLKENTMVRAGEFGFLMWATMNYDFPWLLSPHDPKCHYIFNQETRAKMHFAADEAHRIFVRKALARIKAEPVACTIRVVKASFWSWFDVPGAMKSLDDYAFAKHFLRAMNVLILLAALAGVPAALRHNEGRLAAAIIFYFAFFHAPIFPIPRYYVPVRPLIALLVGFSFMKKTNPPCAE